MKKLVTFFRTNKNFYLYEAYFNNILKISNIAYRAMPLIFKGASAKDLKTKLAGFKRSEINDFIQTDLKRWPFKHLLDDLPAVKAINPVNTKMFLKKIQTEVGQIQLEVTSNCNLRCKYCILGEAYPTEKGYSPVPMSWDTAKRAIDFLNLHSARSKKIYIAFYGGEPLLRFDLIKKAVSYAKRVFKDKKVQYHISTNATLLSDEKCRFLIKEGFYPLISLDGGKAVHDRCRVFKRGKGSFDETLKGALRLKRLDESYFLKNVTFNAVISPPYRFKEIEDFFTKALPGAKVRFSFVKGDNTVYFKKHPVTSGDLKAYRKLLSEFAETKKAMGKKRPANFYVSLQESSLITLHKRSNTNIFGTYGTLTGTCLPGVRKLFVAANGDFHICEKIEHRRPIGNVREGFDLESIRSLFNDYYGDVSKVCTKCWVLRICSFCAAYAMKCGKFSVENKRRFCVGYRKNMKRTLRNYCEILEVNPRAFDYMEKIKMV